MRRFLGVVILALLVAPELASSARSGSPATAVDLGTLGGNESNAVAVNSDGQVVGFSFTAGHSQHAFSWTKTGGMADLGTLGGSYSNAVAVNKSGEVVGYSTRADETAYHAFAWTAKGGMRNLGVIAG